MAEYPEPQFNFQRDLAIDKFHLDTELMAQAQKMMTYSTAHAQAQLDRDRAKMRRDAVEAELDKIARTEPFPSDLPISSKTGQPTEAAVLNWIHKQQNYQEAQKARQEAEYRVNLIFGGVMAMNARKGTLEDLVRLYLNNYWSEPRTEGAAEVKGTASVDASAAAIMRGPESLPEDKDAPKWAIGWESAEGYTQGPFDTKDRALKEQGEENQIIFLINPDGTREAKWWWAPKTKAWLAMSCHHLNHPESPAEQVPKPTPRPRPLPRR